jgi:hypothetical protein
MSDRPPWLPPTKPEEGSPCNGCGLCCAVGTCAAARIAYPHASAPCPALVWSDAAARFTCTLRVMAVRACATP